MSQPTITSRADLMAILGTNLSLNEIALLESTQRGVEGQIRTHCRHGITYQTYVDHLPVSDIGSQLDPLLTEDAAFSHVPYATPSRLEMHVLPLKNGWVRSITEIRENGSGDFSSSDSILSASNYRLDIDEEWTRNAAQVYLSRTGHVLRVGGTWPTSPRTVKVTYTAGLHPDEIDDRFAGIKQAVTEEIVSRFQRQKQRINSDAVGPIRSESLDYYSVTYGGEGSSTSSVSISRELKRALGPWRHLQL